MTISVTNIGSVNNGSVANNGTVTIAFPGTVPAGATIVVVYTAYQTLNITDGANTYSAIDSTNGGGNSWPGFIAAATNVTSRTSSNTITLENVSGSGGVPIVAQAFYLTSSGGNQILNDSATNEGTQSNVGSSVSLTSGIPAHTPDCFIGGVVLSTTGKTIGFGSGWTQVGSTLTLSGQSELAAAYNIESATTTLTVSTSASESWNLVIAGFYESIASITGTWASTEAKDNFSASGSHGPHATWVSFETTDTFAAVGTPETPTGTWASTEHKDTFLASGGLVGGYWASTEAKDIFAAVGNPETPTGTWASTDTKDTFHAIVDPVTGIWGATETPDTFYAKAFDIDSSIIQSMFFPLSMSMTVTEIIPTRIVTNLPGINQIMEVEEVPSTYFVTIQAVTTLKGFSQEATVTVTLPEAVSVAEMDPPGRGGGGGLPTISIERELLDLFGGHAFNRGVDAIVPSTRVAASNLTTAFSPKSVVRPPTPHPPRRRK